VTNDALQSELHRRQFSASIFLNYHLLRLESFALFPFIGYSVTDTNVILSKQVSADEFCSLLESPEMSVNLRHLSYGFMVGMEISLAQHWVPGTGTFRIKFDYGIPVDAGQPWDSRFSNFGQTPLDRFPYFIIQFEMGFCPRTFLFISFKLHLWFFYATF
jgi:hypothetical protein